MREDLAQVAAKVATLQVPCTPAAPSAVPERWKPNGQSMVPKDASLLADRCQQMEDAWRIESNRVAAMISSHGCSEARFGTSFDSMVPSEGTRSAPEATRLGSGTGLSQHLERI